ncbi:MAG: hypothetical protein AAGC85_20665 [Bacteroidota bacterium]
MSLRKRTSAKVKAKSQASVHIIWVGRMLLLVLAAYFFSLAVVPSKSKIPPSKCTECTYVISDSSSAEFKLEGGERICIREGGYFSGRILRWQGEEACHICNEGSLKPAELNLESGITYIDNFREAIFHRIAANSPSLSLLFHNYPGGEVRVDELRLSGASHILRNEGKLLIGDLTLKDQSNLENAATGEVEVLFQTNLEAASWENKGNLIFGEEVSMGGESSFTNSGKVYSQSAWNQNGGKLINEGLFRGQSLVRLDGGAQWNLPGEMLLYGGLEVKRGRLESIHKLYIADSLVVGDTAIWELESQLLYSGRQVKGNILLDVATERTRPSVWLCSPSVGRHFREMAGASFRFYFGPERDIQEELFPLKLTILPHIRRLSSQIQLPESLPRKSVLSLKRFVERPYKPNYTEVLTRDAFGKRVYHWQSDSLVEGIQSFQVEVNHQGGPPMFSEKISVLHVKNQATACWEYLPSREQLKVVWFSSMEFQAEWVYYDKNYQILGRKEAELHKGMNELSLSLKELDSQPNYLRLEARDAHVFYPFIPIQ